jgi:hypothetical protein
MQGNLSALLQIFAVAAPNPRNAFQLRNFRPISTLDNQINPDWETSLDPNIFFSGIWMWAT